MASARFLLLCALLSLANALHRKHLAGPPEEFSNFQIPSPDTVASEARSAQFEMIFEQTSSGSHSWSVSLPVDSDELFSFNLFSPVANSLKISLTDPTGAQVDLSSHTHTGELASFPIGLESIPGINYLFEKPFPKGTYTLTAESVEDISGRVGTSNEADGVVFFYNESPVKAHTYLNTYSLHLGGKIGLVTRLTDDQDGLAQPRALKDVVTKAVMEVREPNGVEEVVQMHDDGLHDDGLANDGIFGGYIPASQTGMYRASAFLEGADSNGNNLVRSTQHLLPIVSEDLTLSGSAYAVSKDVEHVDILLAVNVNAGADQTYKAYAEVWGTSVSGEQIPICWVAGMTDVFEFSGNDYLALELNTNWVIKAGAVAPYTLKNVYVQDVDVFVPIAQLAEIPVNVELATFPTVSAPRDIEITREMREGVFPASLLNATRATRATAAPSLLLVHGYCSDVNPWEKYGSDFTDATFFLEPSASLTNEKFASLVAAYAENIGMTSWSGIGHSQGGIVLTHLKNYYFTGMDLATGGRLIQSVGTPYQGNTGAGSAANLIKIFGFGCGENFDLTKDGSTLWLTGITPETKKEIFYYTTTYKQGNLFGDYCDLAVNLVLKWPNDGTSELSLTSLSGATNLGNKEKWCHTVDMSYDPQYYDHDRNKEMNTRAAR